MALSQEGLNLIKHWEGCRLTAYPDPASGGDPWTIGYGHTGPEVKPGLTISQEQAERWLLEDVAEAEAAIDALIQPPGGLTVRQREALVSFCFNLGAHAVTGSTLRRRLNGGAPVAQVLREELPRWVRGPDGPIEGLVNRRRAELAHALAAHAPVGGDGGRIQLQVPYFCQRDSATAQGSRMCFSSTCAMAAAFLKPGCLAGGGQQDDRYLARLQRHGDTTNASAQIQTLRGLGIQAELRTDGRIEQLIAQLQLGIPIPVGWLHHGPVSAPVGGGHWSLVIGWDPARKAVLMHDPTGEADLVGGGYVTTAIGSGKGLRDSAKNWGRRWMVEGQGTGWWLELAV
ncbi:lysozyme [Cyanobium sp. FGCU-52]|nr:lysozyme [Cyanobium sp. FGCU52]